MKKIKMWIELLFIFLLPLIFMALSVKIETTKEYDENNNEISKLNNFTWEYPYNDFISSNHIINILDYNQYKPNNVFNNNITLNNGYYILDNFMFNSTTTTTFTYNEVEIGHKYYISYSGEGSYFRSNLYDLNNTIYLNTNFTDNWSNIYTANGTVFTINTSVTGNLNYNGKILITFIDLTKMFGQGYEPNNFTAYLDLIKTNENTIESELIEYYTENTNISENWKYNYSVWGTIYNDIIIKNLYLTDTITTRFILTYTITWFIMFIIWHTIYVPFDWLIHLITPKQKE